MLPWTHCCAGCVRACHVDVHLQLYGCPVQTQKHSELYALPAEAEESCRLLDLPDSVLLQVVRDHLVADSKGSLALCSNLLRKLVQHHITKVKLSEDLLAYTHSSGRTILDAYKNIETLELECCNSNSQALVNIVQSSSVRHLKHLKLIYISWQDYIPNPAQCIRILDALPTTNGGGQPVAHHVLPHVSHAAAVTHLRRHSHVTSLSVQLPPDRPPSILFPDTPLGGLSELNINFLQAGVDITAIMRAEHLTSLGLMGSQITCPLPAAVLQCTQLRRLCAVLHIDIPWDHLWRLQQLKELFLYDTSCSGAELQALARMAQLEHLAVAEVTVPEGCAAVLRGLTSLQVGSQRLLMIPMPCAGVPRLLTLPRYSYSDPHMHPLVLHAIDGRQCVGNTTHPACTVHPAGSRSIVECTETCLALPSACRRAPSPSPRTPRAACAACCQRCRSWTQLMLLPLQALLPPALPLLPLLPPLASPPLRWPSSRLCGATPAWPSWPSTPAAFPQYHATWQPCLQHLPNLTELHMPCVEDVAGVARDLAAYSSLASLNLFLAPDDGQVNSQVNPQVVNAQVNAEQILNQLDAEEQMQAKCDASRAFYNELLRHNFSSVEALHLEGPSKDHKYAGVDLGRQLLPLLRKHRGVKVVRALVDALSDDDAEVMLRQACRQQGVRVVRSRRVESPIEHETGPVWVSGVMADLGLGGGRLVQVMLLQQLGSDWDQAQLERLAVMRWGWRVRVGRVLRQVRQYCSVVLEMVVHG